MVWTIPAARYKTKIDFELPLSRAALDVLTIAPRFDEKGFVFTVTGVAGITGFTKFKARFRGQLPQDRVRGGRTDGLRREGRGGTRVRRAS
jgi:hypothetical protein